VSVELPTGAIGLNERLARLEANDQQILTKLETLARNTDVTALEARLTIVERNYVGKGTIWTFAAFITVQFLVIVGLGLGLVYEILRK
jgi:hypothetical protein